MPPSFLRQRGPEKPPHGNKDTLFVLSRFLFITLLLLLLLLLFHHRDCSAAQQPIRSANPELQVCLGRWSLSMIKIVFFSLRIPLIPQYVCCCCCKVSLLLPSFWVLSLFFSSSSILNRDLSDGWKFFGGIVTRFPGEISDHF